VCGRRIGTQKNTNAEFGRIDDGVGGCDYCVAFKRNDKSLSRYSKKNVIEPSLHTCTSELQVCQKMIETLCFCLRTYALMWKLYREFNDTFDGFWDFHNNREWLGTGSGKLFELLLCGCKKCFSNRNNNHYKKQTHIITLFIKHTNYLTSHKIHNILFPLIFTGLYTYIIYNKI